MSYNVDKLTEEQWDVIKNGLDSGEKALTLIYETGWKDGYREGFIEGDKSVISYPKFMLTVLFCCIGFFILGVFASIDLPLFIGE